jgi:hypothetical protein
LIFKLLSLNTYVKSTTKILFTFYFSQKKPCQRKFVIEVRSRKNKPSFSLTKQEKKKKANDISVEKQKEEGRGQNSFHASFKVDNKVSFGD